MERGQVAQLVEQGTENPRVGGSTPSLATTRPPRSAVRALCLLSGLVLLGGCQTDACDNLCQRLARRLGSCMEQWPVGFDELDADGRVGFQQECQRQWSQVRSNLEPREFDDALDQCDQGLESLERMRLEESSCDELRALYLAE